MAKKKKIKGIVIHTTIGKKGIDYPENKRLKKMQAKANRQYKKLKGTMDAITELHTAFARQSVAYAGTLSEIENEAIMPNFGER